MDMSTIRVIAGVLCAVLIVMILIPLSPASDALEPSHLVSSHHRRARAGAA